MIKKFLDCYIPITSCNLKCHYCYIAQLNAFQQKTPDLRYSAAHIRAALSQKRLGGICVINLCGGGETLIPDGMIHIIRELLEEGHYIMVVTNGLLTKRFIQISKFPEKLLSRLFFKFSFHYLELKRLNAFTTFFSNVHLMDSAGCSFTVEMTPNDESIPYIAEIKALCIENIGAPCHLSIGRADNDPHIRHLSQLSFDDYCSIWGEAFPSEMFQFKKSIFYQKRREFCYAGSWSATINVGTGELAQCYGGAVLDNVFKNIDMPVKFRPVGCHCSQPHCYNGHAFLTFGVIPKLVTPLYLAMRDQKTVNGLVWVKPEMAKAFQSKLADQNTAFSFPQKVRFNLMQAPHKVLVSIYHILQIIKYDIKEKINVL